jgi:hypothetical protein
MMQRKLHITALSMLFMASTIQAHWSHYFSLNSVPGNHEGLINITNKTDKTIHLIFSRKDKKRRLFKIPAGKQMQIPLKGILKDGPVHINKMPARISLEKGRNYVITMAKNTPHIKALGYFSLMQNNTGTAHHLHFEDGVSASVSAASKAPVSWKKTSHGIITNKKHKENGMHIALKAGKSYAIDRDLGAHRAHITNKTLERLYFKVEDGNTIPLPAKTGTPISWSSSTNKAEGFITNNEYATDGDPITIKEKRHHLITKQGSTYISTQD